MTIFDASFFKTSHFHTLSLSLKLSLSRLLPVTFSGNNFDQINEFIVLVLQMYEVH